MLAILQRLLLFNKPIINPNTNFKGLNPICWNCLYHSFIRGENEFGKINYLTVQFLNHSQKLQRIKYYRNNPLFPYTKLSNMHIQQFGDLLTTQATSSEDSDELLNHIISQIECSPNLASEISSSQIEKFCSKNNLSAAMKLFQSLRDRQISLNAKAYNLLLVAACKGDDIKPVPQIFKDFLISKKSISADAYSNLAKAFKKINDDVYIVNFITRVSDLTFPSATVINRMIYAFDVCGETEKALLIYDHMKGLDCKPDLITYNTVLGILGRVGRVSDMLREFALMKEAKVIPDIVSYNTLINTFRKLGRVDMCTVLLEEVKELGLELDLRTYTSLIDCFGRSGNIEESLKFFNEMKSKRMRPSIYIYRSLINNAKKLGNTELSLMFLEEMNASINDLIGPKDFKGN